MHALRNMRVESALQFDFVEDSVGCDKVRVGTKLMYCAVAQQELD